MAVEPPEECEVDGLIAKVAVTVISATTFVSVLSAVSTSSLQETK